MCRRQAQAGKGCCITPAVGGPTSSGGSYVADELPSESARSGLVIRRWAHSFEVTVNYVLLTASVHGAKRCVTLFPIGTVRPPTRSPPGDGRQRRSSSCSLMAVVPLRTPLDRYLGPGLCGCCRTPGVERRGYCCGCGCRNPPSRCHGTEAGFCWPLVLSPAAPCDQELAYWTTGRAREPAKFLR